MEGADFGEEEEEKPNLAGSLDSPIHDGSVQQVLELIMDDNVICKREIHKMSRSGLSTVITADLELGDTEMSLVEEVDLDAGSSLEGQCIRLDDGSISFVEPLSLKDEDDHGHLGESPNRFNGQAVQLEDGSTAFLHSTPGEGYQAIQLEDGTMAYISLSPPDHIFEDTEDQSSLEERLKSTKSNGWGKPSSKALALGSKAFKCSYPDCSKIYTTQHHLKVHERCHTGDRPYQCPQNGCGKTFTTSYSLKSHVRVHTGETPYHCPEEMCLKAFKTSGDLQKHIRTHTGERPFTCPFEGCDRAFTTSNIRKVHIRTHTGERPYICKHEGCGRTFASATNFKNHQRIHTGEKPYMCSVPGCRRRFTEYSSLYKHHVVHTVSKPYACEICGRNYRQTSTLAMHKRSSHGIMEPEIVISTDDGADADSTQELFDSVVMMASNQNNVEGNQTIIAGDVEGLSSSASKTTEGNLSATNAPQTGANTVTQIVTQPQIMHSMILSTVTDKSGETTFLTLGPQVDSSSTTNKTKDDGTPQILLVTDPTQLAVLQQLAQQAKMAQSNKNAKVVIKTTNKKAVKVVKKKGNRSATTNDEEII